MKTLLVPVLALFVYVPAASAAPLFATTPNFNAAYGSDYGSVDAFGFRSYDNFLFTTSAHVESLTWDFLFIDLAHPVPAAAPTDDVNQWVVSFYADAGGVPGAELASHTFDPANVTSTFVSQGTYGVSGDTYNVSRYHYAASLPADFLVQQDTVYWLSVFALSDTYSPVAAWRGGTGGLGPSTYREQLGPGMTVTGAVTIASDRAFSLEGRQVPEPSMFLLTAAGLAAAVIRRRRTV
jgi:hypothetical protein